MNRVGDDDAGFSVEVDSATSTVRVRAWGFWGAEVAAAFDTTVGKVCSTSPKGSSLAMDMSALKPMREEGQRAFAKLMSTVRKLGIVNTTVTTASQLTKLQLLRLTAEAGAAGSTRFT